MAKNKFRIFQWFYKLETDAYLFALESKKAALFKKHFFFWIFIVSSLIALFAAFALSVLSALKLAKLWFFAENAQNPELIQNLLNNYVYITNTLSAIVAFVSTLVSFFTFKQGYAKNRTIYKKLDWELFQYDMQLGFYTAADPQINKVILIDRVASILNFPTYLIHSQVNDNQEVDHG